MKVAIILLFITCISAVTADAQPPVSTGSGWAFTCKNGVPVYDGSGTPPTAGGSCKTTAGSSSSTGSQSEVLQGAFNAGVAVNQWLANIERQGRERRAARERARVAAEIARRDQFVRDSITAAAAREATWQRLNSQLRLSAQPQLEMRLGSPSAEIGFRFDGDTGQKDLSNSELIARDRTNCTFMACGEKTAMPELGDPMVVDLRHLRRATHLLRQTEYAPGDERESALDVAMDIIDGGGPEFDVPPDAPEPPGDAARDVGAAVAERKAATAERIQRAATVDSVAQKSEFLSDVEELARGDQTLSDVERAQLLGELARQRRAVDSAAAQARQDLQRAEESERQAVARQRATLYRAAHYLGREPASQRTPASETTTPAVVDLRDVNRPLVVDPDRVRSGAPLVADSNRALGGDPRLVEILSRLLADEPDRAAPRFNTWSFEQRMLLLEPLRTMDLTDSQANTAANMLVHMPEFPQVGQQVIGTTDRNAARFRITNSPLLRLKIRDLVAAYAELAQRDR